MNAMDAAEDRASAYGDGLFETMRAHGDALPWWPRHWARLSKAAARLKIALPGQAVLLDAATDALRAAQLPASVLKLHVARAPGGRGYAPDATRVEGPWRVRVHALPATPGAIDLRWCDTRLAIQPALAGIKHCNRLEQVLARLEWDDLGDDEDRSAFDGLMRSTRGDVVCAVSANVFVYVDGRWVTPCVDRCGVAGVMRGWVMETLDVAQRRVMPAQVEAAEAVFLTNAVRGILPVARIGTRRWMPHADVAALQRALAAAHPGFARD